MIKIDNKTPKVWYGKHKPVNIYVGNNKIAGWSWKDSSGVSPMTIESDYTDFPLECGSNTIEINCDVSGVEISIEYRGMDSE